MTYTVEQLGNSWFVMAQASHSDCKTAITKPQRTEQDAKFLLAMLEQERMLDNAGK